MFVTLSKRTECANGFRIEIILGDQGDIDGAALAVRAPRRAQAHAAIRAPTEHVRRRRRAGVMAVGGGEPSAPGVLPESKCNWRFDSRY